MPPKIPGKLNEPPSEAEFNTLRIAAFCRSKGGIFYRLHPTNRSTGDPWHPVFFSTRGTYASRHAYSRGNLAIFLRDGLRPESYDANLGPANKRWWRREAGHGIAIVHGPQIKLAVHPQLKAILTEEVGVL